MILLLVSSAILAMTPLGTGLRAVPDLPIGYIGLNLGPQDPRGPPKTVVRIESMAGI